jgi:hypothetical protein
LLVDLTSLERDLSACGLFAAVIKSAPNVKRPISGTAQFRLPMGRSFTAV